MSNYTFSISDPHTNQLAEDMVCNDQVTIYTTDAVYFGYIAYVVNGQIYQQKIMNIPWQDQVRTKLYLDYFYADQLAQLSA